MTIKSCLINVTSHKNGISISLKAPFKYWKMLTTSPLKPSFLKAEQTGISQPFFTLQLLSPLIIFVVLLWTLSSLAINASFSGTKTAHEYSKCGLTSIESSAMMIPVSSLLMPLLMQSSILLSPCATVAHCSFLLS